MKKKQLFVCGACGKECKSERGVRIHWTQMHPELPINATSTDAGVVQEPVKDSTTAAAELPQYAILRDFEEAVRGDEMKMSTDAPEAYEEEYKRTKRLLALRILLLMHKAERADWLERELMS
jgi:hypothetical protein